MAESWALARIADAENDAERQLTGTERAVALTGYDALDGGEVFGANASPATRLRAARALVHRAEGLRRRLDRYKAEHRVTDAEDEVRRLWQRVCEARQHEKNGPDYEHPTCSRDDYDGGEDRPHGSIDFPGVA